MDKIPFRLSFLGGGHSQVDFRSLILSIEMESKCLHFQFRHTRTSFDDGCLLFSSYFQDFIVFELTNRASHRLKMRHIVRFPIAGAPYFLRCGGHCSERRAL
jgi:hypothetical protein